MADSDYNALQQCSVKLEQLMKMVNTGVDGLQKLISLQNSFADRLDLTAPERYLIREDDCMLFAPPPSCKQKSRRIFLFNDMIIIAKKDWRERYHLIDRADIAELCLTDIQSATEQPIFEIVFSTRTYLILMQSIDHKQDWLKSWKRAIQAATIPKRSLDAAIDYALNASMKQLAEQKSNGICTPLSQDDDYMSEDELQHISQQDRPNVMQTDFSNDTSLPKYLKADELMEIDLSKDVCDGSESSETSLERLKLEVLQLKKDKRFLQQSLSEKDHENKKYRVELESAQIALGHEKTSRERKEDEINQLKLSIVGLEKRNAELVDIVRKRDTEVHILKTKHGVRSSGIVNNSKFENTELAKRGWSNVQSQYSQINLSTPKSLSGSARASQVVAESVHTGLDVDTGIEDILLRVHELEHEKRVLSDLLEQSRVEKAELHEISENFKIETESLRRQLTDVKSDWKAEKELNRSQNPWSETAIDSRSHFVNEKYIVPDKNEAERLLKENATVSEKVLRLEGEKAALQQDCNNLHQVLEETNKLHNIAFKRATGSAANAQSEINSITKELDDVIREKNGLKLELSETVKKLQMAEVDILKLNQKIEGGQIPYPIQNDRLNSLKHYPSNDSELAGDIQAELHRADKDLLDVHKDAPSTDSSKLLAHNRVLSERVLELQNLCERATAQLKSKKWKIIVKEMQGKIDNQALEISTLRTKIAELEELKSYSANTIVKSKEKQEIELRGEYSQDLEELQDIPEDLDLAKFQKRTSTFGKRASNAPSVASRASAFSYKGDEDLYLKTIKGLLSSKTEEAEELQYKLDTLRQEKDHEIEGLRAHILSLENDSKETEILLQSISQTIETQENGNIYRNLHYEKGSKPYMKLRQISTYAKNIEHELQLKTITLNRIAAIFSLRDATFHANANIANETTICERLVDFAQDINNKTNQLKNEVNSLTKELEHYKHDLTETKAEAKVYIESKEKQLMEIRSKGSAEVEEMLRVKIADLEKTLTDTTKIMNDLNERLQKAIAERESLRGQGAIMTQKLDHCLMENARLEELASEIKSDLKEKLKENKLLLSSQKDLEDRLRVAEDSRQFLDREYIEIKQRSERETKDYTDNLEAIAKELDEVLRWKIDADFTMQDLKFKIQQSFEQKQHLEELVEKATSAKAFLEKEIRDKNKFVPKSVYDSLNGSLENSKLEMSQLLLEKEGMQTVIKQQREEIAELSKNNSVYDQQVYEKTNELERLKCILLGYKQHIKELGLKYEQSIGNRELDIEILHLEIMNLTREGPFDTRKRQFSTKNRSMSNSEQKTNAVSTAALAQKSTENNVLMPDYIHKTTETGTASANNRKLSVRFAHS